MIVLLFSVLGATIVGQSVVIGWIAVTGQLDRRQIVNAALAKNTQEFRHIERETKSDDWRERAERQIAGMEDNPVHMQVGLDGMP